MQQCNSRLAPPTHILSFASVMKSQTWVPTINGAHDILTAVARYLESCENSICVIASLAYLNGSCTSSCSVIESRILTDPFTKPTAENKQKIKITTGKKKQKHV